MDTGRNKTLDSGKHPASGRISTDCVGRNVWQWDGEEVDSTTIMLSRLENSALALEPTRKLPRPELTSGATGARSSARSRDSEKGSPLTLEPTGKLRSGGGFDPYNRS
jgi:hypothetical protein